jgi:hypothetical protein
LGGINPIVTTEAGVTANDYGFCSVTAKLEACNAAFGEASASAISSRLPGVLTSCLWHFRGKGFTL